MVLDPKGDRYLLPFGGEGVALVFAQITTPYGEGSQIGHGGMGMVELYDSHLMIVEQKFSRTTAWEPLKMPNNLFETYVWPLRPP